MVPEPPERAPQPTPGPAVSLHNIRRVFDGRPVIDGLSLDVAAGEFVALLGSSGSGKSTLLRLIAGLDRPQQGIVQRGSDQVAYVFQDAHLLPWRTVFQNVALPLELLRGETRRRGDAIMEVIEQVGLGDAAHRYPNQLSGGMKMRVSLARALVTRPALLLLDEPFAALDEITRQRLDEQLRDLWKSRGLTVIFVTHSTAEAAFLAQRAVVLSSRPARVALDRRIALPAERSAFLRATPEFASEQRALFEALDVRGAA